MIIALFMTLMLCALLVFIGGCVWYIPVLPIVVKVILSVLSIASGVAFGSIIIELIREEFRS